MGKVIKNSIASLNALVSNVNHSNYADYQRTLIESKHNTDFLFATDIMPVKKESPFSSGIFVDIVARVQRVNVPDKAQFLGDDYRQLLFKDTEETVSLGQKFLIDNNYWLCYNANNMGAITKNCFIRRCNHNLKWIDKYGITQIEPCVIDYFKFTFTSNAVEFDKMMRLGGNLRLLILQSNQQTNLLKRDMRFVFNEKAWRITNIEKITHNGLVEITVEEHQINPEHDDLVNNIADYNVSSGFVIKLGTNSETMNSGESETISYTVLYSGAQSSESCTVTTDDETIVSVSGNVLTAESAGAATIRVSLDNNDEIYSEYQITVTDVTEESYISGFDTVKFGGTYRYTVINPVDASYSFSCEDSSIIISTVDNFNIDLKIPNIVKTFVLSATGSTETLVKSISIRSMWQ